MNYLEINWPTNPLTGQPYTSSFGRTWVWNGCGWEATCCPPASCKYYDGLDVTFTFSGAGGVYYNLAFNYSGDDGNGNPIFEFEASNVFSFTIEYNTSISKWEFLFGGSPVAYSSELYGSYGTEWFEYSPSNLEYLTTTCGATFPVLCMEVVSEVSVPQFNLLTAGYSPGEVSVFVPIEGDPIMWDGSQWSGALGSSGNVLISISGSESIPPVGSWNIVDLNYPESVTSVTTTLGPCNFVG